MVLKSIETFYERAKNEMLVEPKKVQTSMSDFLGGEEDA